MYQTNSRLLRIYARAVAARRYAHPSFQRNGAWKVRILNQLCVLQSVIGRGHAVRTISSQGVKLNGAANGQTKKSSLVDGPSRSAANATTMTSTLHGGSVFGDGLFAFFPNHEEEVLCRSSLYQGALRLTHAGDSQADDFLIHHGKHMEACDGGSD